MTISADSFYPNIKLQRVAFGSCHSRGQASKVPSGTKSEEGPKIWHVIAHTVQPQVFLWTGDAIYPPMKNNGDYPLDIMHDEFQQMIYNDTLGYDKFSLGRPRCRWQRSWS
mmetsp:Transcript_24590/g.59282  ORF Transcript_24590/g.59282 Transcript_24590/m.59282 type:complete len:111 (+) Transcript_24590:192-524(+)